MKWDDLRKRLMGDETGRRVGVLKEYIPGCRVELSDTRDGLVYREPGIPSGVPVPTHERHRDDWFITLRGVDESWRASQAVYRFALWLTEEEMLPRKEWHDAMIRWAQSFCQIHFGPELHGTPTEE